MIAVTRYVLASSEDREASDELKAWLLGSDRPVLPSTTISSSVPTDNLCCLGMMSASEIVDLMTEKTFPVRQKSPEPVK